jgi:hypothetical protein
MKEQEKYQNRQFDPLKPVFLQMAALNQIIQFVDFVREQDREVKFKATLGYQSKKNGAMLKGKKPKEEVLNKNYEKVLDLAKTEENFDVYYGESGMAAEKIRAIFEDIYRYNVDMGNTIPVPQQIEEDGIEEEE